jgi:tetratricopeptide (TPR) repeat protein
MGICPIVKLLPLVFLGIVNALASSWASDYTKATAAYERGDYATAEQHDRAALQAAESFAPTDPRLSTTLTQLAAILQARGACCEAETYMRRAASLSEAQFGVHSIEAANAFNNLAAVLRQDGKADESSRVQAGAFATADSLLEPKSAERVPFLTLAAIMERDAAHYEKAETSLRQAQVLLEGESSPDLRQTMQILKYLGTVYRSWGRFDEAKGIYEKLIALSETKLGADTIDTAIALSNLGDILCERKFYAEGRPYLKRAVEIYQRIHEDGSPFFVSVLQTLSSAELYLGQVNSAENRMIFALELLDKQKPPNQEAIAVAHNNLGQVYAAEGRFGEAERETLRAKDIWVLSAGGESAKVATVLSNLGGLYVQERKYKKAERVYNESARIDAKAEGETSIAYARDLNRIGVLYNAQKRFTDAETTLRIALAIDSQKLGNASPILAEPYLNLGLSLEGQRRLDESLESYRRGVEIMTNAGQRNAPNMAVVLFQYSALLREMKRWADAERISTEALGIQVKHPIF